MKNEGMKQSNILMKWLEMNDIEVDDMIVTIKLNNDVIYKIMNDGSVMRISSKHSKAFSNANEAITNAESNVKDSTNVCFKIVVPIQKIKEKFGTDNKEELQKIFDDMTVRSVQDNFAYLTYNGADCEEPDTVSADFKMKYGFKPLLIERQ